jgi:hypothetical protein
MRSISGRVFVTLIAVLAMSVVGSASASAAGCHGATKKVITLCVNEEAQVGEVTFKATKTLATSFSLGLFNGEIVVECKTENSKGVFNAAKESLTVGKLVVEFTGCTVAQASTTCEVTGGHLILDGGEGTGTGPGLQGTFAEGEPGQITLTGPKGLLGRVGIKSLPGKTCAVAHASSSITGTQKCEIPSNAVEALAHAMNCNGTGSSLEWSGYHAYFTASQELKLRGEAWEGKKWSLYYEK